VAALTEGEARARAALIDVESYELFLDLAAEPARSRTEIRFGCREPGASTFAELETAAVRHAELNGRGLGPVRDGRLELPALAARNVLVAEAEVAYSGNGRGLSRFTDPADGAGYVSAMCYPTHAPSVFCCFDQPGLTAVTTLSLRLPAGWQPVSMGPAVPGEGGLWRFGPVPGTRPYDLTFSAGRYVPDWTGRAGAVRISVLRRRSLDGARGVAEIGRFGETARRALEYYERALGVPCAYPKYDIAFVPELTALAVSVPGLMLVSEDLLTRLADAEDEFAVMVCAHEVAHLWFGGHVSMRWWDDLWLDEAVATYLSYTAMGHGALGTRRPVDRVLLPGEGGRLPGRRAAGQAGGVLAGGHSGRRHVQAAGADVLQGRQRDQAAGRADRRGPGAGWARRLRRAVRRRRREPFRPG
jgi:aminopeptidase N